MQKTPTHSLRFSQQL